MSKRIELGVKLVEHDEALPLLFASMLLDATCANLPRVLCCHGGRPHGFSFSRGLEHGANAAASHKHLHGSQL